METVAQARRRPRAAASALARYFPFTFSNDLRFLLERRIAQKLANDAEARLDVRMSRELDERSDELLRRVAVRSARPRFRKGTAGDRMMRGHAGDRSEVVGASPGAA